MSDAIDAVCSLGTLLILGIIITMIFATIYWALYLMPRTVEGITGQKLVHSAFMNRECVLLFPDRMSSSEREACWWPDQYDLDAIPHNTRCKIEQIGMHVSQSNARRSADHEVQEAD